jgi:hypothetical protein
LTRDAASTVADLKKAETESLGVERFMLLNAAPFGPGSHDGHKMEARGLLYREPGENRITLSSLQMLSDGAGEVVSVGPGAIRFGPAIALRERSSKCGTTARGRHLPNPWESRSMRRSSSIEKLQRAQSLGHPMASTTSACRIGRRRWNG